MSRTKQAARRAKNKRADSAGTDERAAKKQKSRETELAAHDGGAKSAVSVIEQLLGGMSFDAFKQDYFEKKPLLVRSNSKNKLFQQSLFSRNHLLQLAAKSTLEHGKDMTVCRYIEGERDNYIPKDGNLRASKKNLGGLFDKGYSCQFYQPQRHVDGLYEINAAFEETFGCLAGASAYLTPPAAQALAPHHDDVEVFILQTEGKKTWKLYHPLVELAGEHSSDLSHDMIGDAFDEFTLEEGDVLYFPRGIIHQACTSDNHFSTHVTISVYQHNSWANYLEVALPRIIRRAFDSDVAFRRGLPIGYLNYLGTQHPNDDPNAIAFNNHCKELLEKLSSWVTPEDLQQAADEAALDYFANRLPPTAPLTLGTAEFVLESDATVRLRDRSHVRLVLGESELKEPSVSVFHSVGNCRIHHMGMCSCMLKHDSDDQEEEGGGSEDEDDASDSDVSDAGSMEGPPQPHCLTFPGSLTQPLLKLYSAYPNTVTVNDLVAVAEDETEVRGMLLRLWSDGLLQSK